MSTNCTYRFHTSEGQVTIQGMAAMKAFLATNGVGAIIKPPSKVKATARAAIEASAPAQARMSPARAPAFYSQLQRAIEQVPARLSTMAAPQWAQWLKANASKLGVKQDEITWSGIEDYLKLRGKDKIDSAELAAWVGANGVQITETTLGNDVDWAVYDPMEREELYFPTEAEARAYAQENSIPSVEVFPKKDRGNPTKYGDYTVPGGAKYRELLLTLPEKSAPAPEMMYRNGDDIRAKSQAFVDGGFSPDAVAAAANFADNGGSVAEGLRIQDRLISQGYGYTQAQKDAGQILRTILSGHEKRVASAAAESSRSNYKSSHWDQPNILAHVRVDERTDADGKRVLFVGELQSDWGQEGRKKGFKGEMVPGFQVQWNGRPIITYETQEEADAHVARALSGDPSAPVSVARVMAPKNAQQDAGKVPLAPFVTKTDGWLNLALKRIAMLAVEGGYDKVAFISGKQAADLYKLSNQIDRIDHNRNGDGTYNLSAIKDGREVFSKEGVPEDGLEDIVGKEVAQKIVNGDGRRPEEFDEVDRWEPEDDDGGDFDFGATPPRTLAGLDLEVGGDGMKGFYDQIVPQAISKLLPKLGGGKLSNVTIPSSSSFDRFDAVENGQVVWTFDSRAPAERWAAESGGRSIRASGEMLEQTGFEVTDKMRDTVLSGVPLFSRERAAADAESDVDQTQDKYNQRIEALRELVACLTK